MKKVIINGRFTSAHINGIPRYATEIVKRLDLRFEKGQLEMVVPKDASNIPQLKNIKIIKLGRCNGPICHIFWDNILKKYIIKNNAECVNFTNRGENVSNSLTMIHDIIPIYGKGYDTVWNKKSYFLLIKKKCLFYLWVHMKRKNAKYIITVSEFSKKCICERFHVESEKVLVIGNGWEHINKIKSVNEQNDNKIKPGKYFFTIGNVFPYKNIKWIINEAKLMPAETFVIAGKLPSDFVNTFSQSLPNVIFLGYISDNYMKYLMENCKALLFPSLIEGFGIPPLEALALNVPVIASDIPVMREIYEDAIHYINPYDVPIDLNKVLKQPLDSDRQNILQNHSWDKMADMWEKLIRESSLSN